MSYPINRDFLIACVEKAADHASLTEEATEKLVAVANDPERKYIARGDFYVDTDEGRCGCPLTEAGFYTVQAGITGIRDSSAWLFIYRFDALTRTAIPPKAENAKLLEIV